MTPPEPAPTLSAPPNRSHPPRPRISQPATPSGLPPEAVPATCSGPRATKAATSAVPLSSAIGGPNDPYR